MRRDLSKYYTGGVPTAADIDVPTGEFRNYSGTVCVSHRVRPRDVFLGRENTLRLVWMAERCEKERLSTLKCYVAAGTGSGRFTEVDLYPDDRGT